MTDQPKGLFGGLFRGIRKKAEDAVAEREAAFVRGKVAGRTVRAPDGTVVIEAGRIVDEATIQRAIQCGRLTSVMQAVAMAQAQDLKEKAEQVIERTDEGREARNVESVDDYVAARRYVGRVAVIAVTDIRGQVLVPAGKEITEDDVRRARDAGQLSALIYSAQQPQPPRQSRSAPAAPPAREDDAAEARVHDADQRKRATLPFVPPPGKDPE